MELLKIKIYFQRSWNLYKLGYGTLSLFLYFPQGAVKQYKLFHWKCKIKNLCETQFRRQVLNKLSPPPWKGIHGFFIRAIYAYADSGYPTRIRLYHYKKWQQFVGYWYAKYIMNN